MSDMIKNLEKYIIGKDTGFNEEPLPEIHSVESRKKKNDEIGLVNLHTPETDAMVARLNKATDDLKMIKSAPQIKKCPICGCRELSELNIPIGAIPGVPTHKCSKCHSNVGSLPFSLDENGENRDYRDLVTSVLFEKRGRLMDESVRLEKTDNGFILDVQPNIWTLRNSKEFFQMPMCRELTDKEWQHVLDRLFRRMYLHEWKHRYEDPLVGVLDGFTWYLTVEFMDDRKMVFEGDESFLPPYWRELVYTFKPFFKETLCKK